MCLDERVELGLELRTVLPDRWRDLLILDERQVLARHDVREDLLPELREVVYTTMFLTSRR